MSDLDFRQHGACRRPRYNPDWWTAPSELHRGYARYICHNDCPVLAGCAAWATAHPQLCDGAVYGGQYYTSGKGSVVAVAARQPPQVAPFDLDRRRAPRTPAVRLKAPDLALIANALGLRRAGAP